MLGETPFFAGRILVFDKYIFYINTWYLKNKLIQYKSNYTLASNLHFFKKIKERGFDPLKSEKPRLAGVKLPANFTLLHSSLPLHRSKSHAIHGRSAPKRNIEGCLTFGFLKQKNVLASVLLIADTCTEKYFSYVLYTGGNGGSDEISLRFFFAPPSLRFFWAPTPESVLIRPSFFCARALDGKSGVAR